MDSLEVYTKLTIGDGLASQVPAFILSVSAGMLVTRSTAKTNMGEEIIGQMLSRPVALGMAACFLLVLSLTPLPSVPLVTMAAGCGLLAYYIRQKKTRTTAKRASDERAKEKAKPERIEDQLTVDALELQIGVGLVRIVDRNRGGDLLDRISSMRKQMATELGLVVPPVRIRDNASLEPTNYALLLRGEEIARGDLHPDELLAIDSGLATEPIHGAKTTEPAFGLTAWWISPTERHRAEQHHYTVVEPTGVVATHLTELIKRHADELLTRAETNKLLEALKQRNAPLVDEVVPKLLPAGQVQKVLQSLLRERVPIRDLETVLEAVGDWAAKTQDPEILTEYARNALARTICAQYRDSDNTLHCITLDPRTEDYIQGNIQRLDQGSTLTLPPERQSALATRAQKLLERASATAGGAAVILLCAPPIRAWVRRMIEPLLPLTPVLGLNEVIRGIEVKAHGIVNLDEQSADISRQVHA